MGPIRVKQEMYLDPDDSSRKVGAEGMRCVVAFEDGGFPVERSTLAARKLSHPHGASARCMRSWIRSR